ncbi:MAG: response regulator [Sulfurospirillaceae bacterium]|nr:response regulator [Sulfurospirillaceae bacterium]MDD2826079.1 response regulator [Sulfurospirillaceae bacterium]
MDNAIDQLITWSKDLKVLYVEDDISLREEVSIFLSDIFESVDLANNGQEGLDKLALNHYDIVITDIRMPVMDGIEMIEKIKELYPEQPILITSAHNEIEYLLKLINLGVDNFITKPLQSEQIFKVLHKMVERIKQKNELQKYKDDLENANAKLHKLTLSQSKDIDLKTSVLKSYKKALDAACIVSLTNSDGIIQDVNENFCNATGYSKQEVIGQKHRIITHPSTDQELFTNLWKTILEKRIWQGLIVNQTKQLTLLYHYTTIVPILGPNGDIIEFISIIQDLTELYKGNEAKNKENISCAIGIKSDELLKTIPFPSALIDNHFVFQTCNTALKNLVDEHSDEQLLVKLTSHTLTLKELVFFEEMDYFETIDSIQNNWPYEGNISFKGIIKSLHGLQEVLVQICKYHENQYIVCIVKQEDFELCCQVHER